jgi:serine/threonine-protein kinase
MELLRGESLRARMVRDGPIAPNESVRLLLPALEGLAAAHRLGIVHRDLKPENLFLVSDTKGGTTKVLDFGISKFQRELDDIGRAMTQSGLTIGTPSYMSPEQVRGARDLDERTDIWAIGVILHELLAGQAPFRADSYGALLVAIATEPPAELPAHVPAGLRAVVERALVKEPAGRFASVRALAEALMPFGDAGLVFHGDAATTVPPPGLACSQGDGPSERAPSEPTRAARPAALGRPAQPRRWWPALAGIVGLGTLVAALPAGLVGPNGATEEAATEAAVAPPTAPPNAPDAEAAVRTSGALAERGELPAAGSELSPPNAGADTPREDISRAEPAHAEALRADAVRGATVRGATVRGATVRGATARGATVRGDTVRGDGATVRGDTVHEGGVRTDATHADAVPRERTAEVTPAAEAPPAEAFRGRSGALSREDF